MTPLLLGHRGAPGLAPENTLASFQAALAAGLDGVELDVRRLADGTLAVHHDAALPGGRRLAALTAAELPPQVPTLPAALAWAADTGAFVNVELKFEGPWPDDRVAGTLRAVTAHGLTRRVIVSSFLPTLLRAARDLAPQIERGLLVHRAYPPPLLRAGMRWTGSAALHPEVGTVDARLLALARAQGWRVHAWTVNDPAEVKRLSALGVDGLIGDDPAALLGARLTGP
ncbi:glycerophosphodiester phosphodiesterase [Deinococcus multiflagellatus]|uniref:glycerophosphodiester phosphodiesterase n=1 Tax=Deinococcus multiflagellatus TaxID=1656887 RepID=UPI001CCBEDDB|nr:glycerophosphodiester phosphodiesterase [Deinococcus multiflagellatus]MBZ9712339.1 glycerophosphodiester phosphodiesterase [Deinococcus multiflagellatus]